MTLDQQQHIKHINGCKCVRPQSPLSQTQKRSSVPRLFILYSLNKMTNASLPLNAKEDFIFISSLHNPLCCYDPFG